MYRCISCSADITVPPVFFAEQDYRTYLHWLHEALKEADCQLHAYVLMTNHHEPDLLITPEEAHVPARLMQPSGRHYVQYINRTYKGSGSLWERRYKLISPRS